MGTPAARGLCQSTAYGRASTMARSVSQQSHAVGVAALQRGQRLKNHEDIATRGCDLLTRPKPLVAFQTQTQNRRVLPTQFPKSQLVALNRKSQLDTLRFGTQFPKSHWLLSFSDPKSQRSKSQRLQDANATKSQTLAFHKSQRFSATEPKPCPATPPRSCLPCQLFSSSSIASFG